MPPSRAPAPTSTIQLTPDELDLLCDAIDSHVYWQLSDPRYRRDGHVMDPGSDDPELGQQITSSQALLQRLQDALNRRTDGDG